MKQIKFTYYKQIITSIVFVFIFLAANFENEESLIKAAEKHFSKEEYAEALPMYSQLVASYPSNEMYNFNYGVALLYAGTDKSPSLKFLKYAVEKNYSDPKTLFYLARAYHLNYYFKEAEQFYQKYITQSGVKKKELKEILEYIQQCKNGANILGDLKMLQVVGRKKMAGEGFFRAYKIDALDRRILFLPEELLTKADNKNNHHSLIVHHPKNQEIYFSSYGKKGADKDIYKVSIFPDGSYGPPVKLSLSINTDADEDYPYLHPSGKILYFASKGHNSIGGYDIFRSNWNAQTQTWNKAVNVGFTINSPDDDYLYISDLEEDIAYFTSNRVDVKGQTTIYKILPSKELEQVVLAKIRTYTNSGKFITQQVSITDLSTTQLLGEYTPNPKTGEINTLLPHDKAYYVRFTYEGKTISDTLILPNILQGKTKVFDLIVDDQTYEVVVREDKTGKINPEDYTKMLRAAAAMDMELKKEVQFNQPASVPRYQKPQKDNQLKTDKPLTESDIAKTIPPSIKSEQSDQLSEHQTTITKAKQEVESLKDEQKQLQSEIQAAYQTGQAKRAEARTRVDRLYSLNENLAQASSEEEKEATTQRINKEQDEIVKLQVEATTAIKLMQNKEQSLQLKEKEVELVAAYIKALELAGKSGNSPKEIQDLEQIVKKMTAIQQQIVQKDKKEENDLAKEIQQKKVNLSIKNAELAATEDELDALFIEAKKIQSALANTSNPALKDELETQLLENALFIQSKQQTLIEQQLSSKVLTNELTVIQSDDFNEFIREQSSQYNDETFTADFRKAIQVEENHQKNQTTDEAAFKAAFLKSSNTVDDIKRNFELADKLTEVSALDDYRNSVDKLSLEKDKLENLLEEEEMLTLVLKNTQKPIERKSLSNELETLEQQITQTYTAVQQASAIANGKKNKAKEEDLAQTQLIIQQQDDLENYLRNYMVLPKAANPVNNQAVIRVSDQPTEKSTPKETLVKTPETPTVDKYVAEIKTPASNDGAKPEQIKDPAAEALVHFGTAIDLSFGYTPDVKQAQLHNKAKQLVDEVNANYQEANLLQTQGGVKNEKNAARLLSNAEKKQEEIQQIYGALNNAEQNNLNNSVKESLKEGYIAKEHQQAVKEIQKNATKSFKNAQELRNQATKNKNNKTKQELYNQAYQKEISALSTLNEVINGKYDEQAAGLLATYAVATPKSSFISDNSANQIADLRVKAAASSNEMERINLLKSARELELASDEVRTTRLMSEAKGGKDLFDKRSAIVEVAKEQAFDNSQAYKAYEQELSGDSIYDIANLLLIQAELSTDKLIKVENIERAKSLFTAAKKMQDEAIQYYQASAFNPSDIAFDPNKSETPQSAVNTKTPNESIPLALDKEIKFNEFPMDKEDLAELAASIPNNNQQEILKAYTDVLDEAVAIEEQEAQRVDEIMELIQASRVKKSAYEAVLMEMDALEDDKLIIQKIQEAELIRGEAEVLELKAKRSEEILKNNMAEAKAKRREADLIQEAMDEENQLTAKQKALATAKSKQKVEQFVNGNKVEESPASGDLAQTETKTTQTTVPQPAPEKSKIEQLPTLADLPKEEQKTPTQTTSKETPEVSKPDPVTLTTSTNQEEEIFAAFTSVLAAAEMIEKNEAKRVDKINALKADAQGKKDAYEAILMTIDELDEALIPERIMEAEVLRAEAEKFELEAKREEAYLKNSMAEANAKRMEAELIKEAMDELNQQKANNQTLASEEHKQKVNQFLTQEHSTRNNFPSEEVVQQKQTTKNNDLTDARGFKAADLSGSRKEKPVEKTVVNTLLPNTNPAIDWDNISLLGGSEELISENFKLNPNYVQSKIELDAPLPKGLLYKVQVGAFKNTIDPSVFKGISPISGETTPFGYIRYTAGLFRGFSSANVAKEAIRDLGYRDAFVVVFYNGKRISVDEAENIMAVANATEKSNYEALIVKEVDQLKKLGFKVPSTSSVAGTTQIQATQSALIDNSANVRFENSLNNREELFYTVQIGAFSSPKTVMDLYNVQPLYTFTLPNGIIRYSTGIFSNYPPADTRKNEVRLQGAKDAFVVAYQGGKLILMEQARNLSGDLSTVEDKSIAEQNDGGVVYKIQVGVYRTPISVTNTPVIQDIVSFGIDYTQNANGVYVYTVGDLNTKLSADRLLLEVKNAGVKDAFIVAFKNKQRIPIQDAVKLTGE